MSNINDYKPDKLMCQQDVTIRLVDLTPTLFGLTPTPVEREDNQDTLADALLAINSLRSQVQLLGEDPVL